ncbi:MAG: hypothetical protein ABIP03_06035 [Aquihabitans sp.]
MSSTFIEVKAHGTNSSEGQISVECGDDGAVWLTISPEKQWQMAGDEGATDRILAPAEARALAAALVHYAAEAER